MQFFHENLNISLFTLCKIRITYQIDWAHIRDNDITQLTWLLETYLLNMRTIYKRISRVINQLTYTSSFGIEKLNKVYTWNLYIFYKAQERVKIVT